MVHLLHITAGTILVTAHSIFLFRALAKRGMDWKPTRLDRIARNISHLALPLALLTGILAAISTADGNSLSGNTAAIHFPFSVLRVFHIVIAFMPLAAIIVMTPFLSFRRRIPWLLPVLNMILFVLAALSGLILVVLNPT